MPSTRRTSSSDEIDRRDSHGLALRVLAATFDQPVAVEQIVWDTPVSFDRARVRELFSLRWQAQQLGPALGQFVTVLLSGTFPWMRTTRESPRTSRRSPI